MPAGTVFEYIGPDVAGPVDLSVASQTLPRPDPLASDLRAVGLRRLRERPDRGLQPRQRGRATGSSSPRTPSTTRRAAAPASAASRRARTSSSRSRTTRRRRVDESRYIKLARTEQQAIDGKAIDLTPPTGGPTARQRQRATQFDAADATSTDTTRSRSTASATPSSSARRRSTASRAAPTTTGSSRTRTAHLYWRSPDCSDRRHARTSRIDRGPRTTATSST